jgi:hypothetical protein
MEVSDVRRMKDLEDEYARLKNIVANITLEIIPHSERWHFDKL